VNGHIVSSHSCGDGRAYTLVREENATGSLSWIFLVVDDIYFAFSAALGRDLSRSYIYHGIGRGICGVAFWHMDGVHSRSMHA
jgi:hypothetical protein